MLGSSHGLAVAVAGEVTDSFVGSSQGNGSETGSAFAGATPEAGNRVLPVKSAPVRFRGCHGEFSVRLATTCGGLVVQSPGNSSPEILAVGPE